MLVLIAWGVETVKYNVSYIFLNGYGILCWEHLKVSKCPFKTRENFFRTPEKIQSKAIKGIEQGLVGAEIILSIKCYLVSG